MPWERPSTLPTLPSPTCLDGRRHVVQLLIAGWGAVQRDPGAHHNLHRRWQRRQRKQPGTRLEAGRELHPRRLAPRQQFRALLRTAPAACLRYCWRAASQGQAGFAARAGSTASPHPVVLRPRQQLRVAPSPEDDKISGQAHADAAVLRKVHRIGCRGRQGAEGGACRAGWWARCCSGPTQLVQSLQPRLSFVVQQQSWFICTHLNRSLESSAHREC